jgi:hypothetical protein
MEADRIPLSDFEIVHDQASADSYMGEVHEPGSLNSGNP